jgi:hypothetical protein
MLTMCEVLLADLLSQLGVLHTCFHSAIYRCKSRNITPQLVLTTLRAMLARTLADNEQLIDTDKVPETISKSRR